MDLIDKAHCICGKEMSMALIGNAAFPLGENCFFKAIDRNVTWDRNIKPKALSSMIRNRKGFPLKKAEDLNSVEA